MLDFFFSIICDLITDCCRYELVSRPRNPFAVCTVDIHVDFTIFGKLQTMMCAAVQYETDWQIEMPFVYIRFNGLFIAIHMNDCV